MDILMTNSEIIYEINKILRLKDIFWSAAQSSKVIQKFELYYGVEYIMKDSKLVFGKNKIFEKHPKITDEMIKKLNKELKNKYDVVCDDEEDYNKYFEYLNINIKDDYLKLLEEQELSEMAKVLYSSLSTWTNENDKRYVRNKIAEIDLAINL
jgi:hypothetical protein